MKGIFSARKIARSAQNADAFLRLHQLSKQCICTPTEPNTLDMSNADKSRKFSALVRATHVHLGALPLKPRKNFFIGSDILRTRQVKLQLWLNEEEAETLNKLASATGLSKSTLMRALIMGYRPREKPDERFYEFQRELTTIGNNVNQLAAKANALGYIDAPMLMEEAERWAKFQTEVQKKFLVPEDNIKWR